MLTFNFERVKALFIREFHLGFKPVLKIAFALTFGIFLANLIIALVSNDKNVGSDDLSPTMIKYGLLLMIGGLISASMAFREFSKLPSRAEYLALPGSSLEKVFVKWLFTNPIFILVFTIIFWILASLIMPFIADYKGYVYQNEIFTTKNFWILVGIFFITHSIFFFGSITFNRVPAVLTIVALIIIALGVIAMNAVWFRIIWADMFEGLFKMTFPIQGNMEFGVNYNDPGEMWQIRFFEFAFKYLLAPILWVASIFKLSEKQV